MATYEQRVSFLDEYFKLCRKYGVYVGSARGSRDLRVFTLIKDREGHREYEDCKFVLLQDIGAFSDNG